MDDLSEQTSNLQLESKTELKPLIIIASTFMDNRHECVMAWSGEKSRLLRPITNLKTNSWDSGTFTVGLTYEFKILDWNPRLEGPHKGEDILVKAPRTLGESPLDETAMYKKLESSSKTSVTEVFPADEIKENKYIEELTNCPSAGIIRCKVKDISLFKNDYEKDRCKIFENYDFPMTAKNTDSLKADLKTRSREDCLLVLLGLTRPFAGEEKKYKPRRCYIMVIGIIRAAQAQANESQPED